MANETKGNGGRKMSWFDVCLNAETERVYVGTIDEARRTVQVYSHAGINRRGLEVNLTVEARVSFHDSGCTWRITDLSIDLPGRSICVSNMVLRKNYQLTDLLDQGLDMRWDYLLRIVRQATKAADRVRVVASDILREYANR